MPGRLHFPDGSSYDFTAGDLAEGDCIGTGSYGGVVAKMIHRESTQLMAVKVHAHIRTFVHRSCIVQRVRAHEIDTSKREKMLRELKIIIQSQNCEDIVRFYGALFQDVRYDADMMLLIWDLGRLLDLHGTDGHLARPVLQARLRPGRAASRANRRLHHSGGKLTPHHHKRSCLVCRSFGLCGT